MITDLTQKNMERTRNLISEYGIKSLLSKELGGVGPALQDDVLRIDLLKN